MNFPSLLYPSEPTARPISRSVFEDLQLTQLLSSDAIGQVLVPCTAEQIPARHEMFRAITGDASFLSHLRDLRALSLSIGKLDEALGEAEGKEEKNVIPAYLLAACIEFFDLASSFAPSGASLPSLYVRFAEAMKENAASLAGVREALASLLPEFEKMEGYTLRLHGKTIRGALGCGESYLSRLLSCAENLGVGEVSLPSFPPKQLSPEILSSLSTLCPDQYAAFAAFTKKNGALYDAGILTYIGQLGFYLEMAELLGRVREHGIPLTYPTLKKERGILIGQAYDISLFAKNEFNIVPNDIEYTPECPFYYLTGANGGGKTTYLRTVGIACVMLLLGCPIACESAVTSVPSGVFTHFPRDERFDGSGRFVEEQRRVEAILRETDGDAVILLNETYSTTNEENAVKMTTLLAEDLYARRIFGLYITHQHSIAQTGIPYLNVLVDRDEGNRRTYKIVKQRNVGDSFALDILKKYRLTKEALEERFGKENA